MTGLLCCNGRRFIILRGGNFVGKGNPWSYIPQKQWWYLSIMPPSDVVCLAGLHLYENYYKQGILHVLRTWPGVLCPLIIFLFYRCAYVPQWSHPSEQPENPLHEKPDLCKYLLNNLRICYMKNQIYVSIDLLMWDGGAHLSWNHFGLRALKIHVGC